MEYYTAIKKTTEAFYVRNGIEQYDDMVSLGKKRRNMYVIASVCALKTSGRT